LSTDLTAGTRLAQYEIVSAVGAGGMGVVYRARDTRLGRDVALKVMAPHIASDPVMRGRFETEARAVASLSHPGILSIYELAVADGIPFAVMELLEGRNLRERMAGGPLPWREAVEIAASIADGLAAAHAKGIIHRDLKPENVFLTTEGHVKILDFGLALQRLELTPDPEGPTIARTVEGIVLGTFGYMSPEQVTGERVDARTDIFALGCLLYEMLAGRQLFSGTTPQELVAKLLHDTAPDLSVFDPLAPQELRAITARCIEKNIDRRFGSAQDVAIALRALLSGSAARLPRHARSRGKSLAILPFVNAADPQLDYLSDGITESIINTLSQLESVRVVPRSLVFRYKGLQADPSTVGVALNAKTILTGRLTQHGDMLSIQAELVDTGTESQLWGEQYRRKLADVITVQEEIAWQISEALRLKLSSAQKKKLRKRATVNPDAYQAYLRGRHYWNQWSPGGFRKAVESFQQAIDFDPLYAAAYAGLGDSYGTMAYYGYVDPRDGYARARAAARRAVELDPALADAHVTLALGRLFKEWDWQDAGKELQQAITLNPKLAVAHSVNAIYLATCGEFEEALKEAKTGRDLDPLSLMTNMSVAWIHHFAGNHEAAAREAHRARELAPELEEAGNVLCASYDALGRHDEAARLIGHQRCWGVDLDGPQLLAAYERGGADAYWRSRLEMLEKVSGQAPSGIHFGFAIIHQQLGETERALDHLEQMVDAHVGQSVFIGVDPMLRSLRGNERFEAILRRVGSPMASVPHTAST
jgi:serine/threonine protein kinase/tetratricopeptide (TPR) repeat protein